MICRRSMASPSRSRRTSTSPAHRPPWASRRWQARTRAWTPRRRAAAGGRRDPDRPHQLPQHHDPLAHRQRTLGRDRESWDRSRTPGASSGGEAAALATGMTPLGLGNDGLGSLRWPAQCCGIGVLKPTLGRIPHATTIEPMDAPIGDPADGRRRPDGAAGCRPPGRLRGAGRAHLARPLDGAGTAPRPRTRQAHPGGPRGRPGRPGHRQAGAGRSPEGGPGARGRRLRRRGGRAAVDRRGGEDSARHAQHSRHPGGCGGRCRR